MSRFRGSVSPCTNEANDMGKDVAPRATLRSTMPLPPIKKEEKKKKGGPGG